MVNESKRSASVPDVHYSPRLLSPIRLRGITLKNRIVIAPMAMYSACEGFMDDFHLVHLGRFALGGAGLVLTEATAVNPEGRITPGCVGLWSDAQCDAIARVPALLHRFGAAAGIQLAHAGRKGSSRRPWHGGFPLDDSDILSRGESPWSTVSPTAQPFAADLPAPRALGESDMTVIVDDFASAARRANRASFDVIELHCAHGYLLHSFLSPLSNHRIDRWGGDLASRMRFPLRVVQAVRDAWPAEKPLFVRISMVDGQDVGWSIDDSVQFARALKSIGVDIIDCSSGGMKLRKEDQLLAREPGFHVPLAAQIRHEAGLPTIAVGLIRDPRHAEQILVNEASDLIAIGREALFDPNWPLHAAHVLGDPHAWHYWPKPFAGWLERRAQIEARTNWKRNQ